MTKSKGKAVAASQTPSTSVARTSIVISKKEFEPSPGLQSRKYQNVSFNRSTGRWQAWTNCMSTKKDTRGPYVGQHSTEYLAARAQDRSLLKHRALATRLPIRLNYPESDYASDEKLRNALTNEEFIRLLKREARLCYTKVEHTKCMQMFLEEEHAQGNLPMQLEGKAKATSEKVKSLRDFLMETFHERISEVTPVAPKKLMFKLGRKHKANIDEIIDDLLRDDNDNADEDIIDPYKVQDHENQLSEEEKDELANLVMLATVALTHRDLKPYKV